MNDQRQVAQVRLDASLHTAAFDPCSGQVIAAGAAGATLLRLRDPDLAPGQAQGV